MSLAQRFIGVSPVTARSIQGDSSTIAAAGSTQGTATSFQTAIALVTSGSGGVILSAAGAGDSQFVLNTSGSSITVYPPSGSKINQLSANAGSTLANNTACMYVTASATQVIANMSA